MQRVVPLQHVDEFLDTLGARFGFLRRLNSAQYSITILLIERSEKSARLRIVV
jgi:hypothetical protein